MKYLLISLLIAVIVLQSFSLHRCKCDVNAVFYYKGKYVYTYKIRGTYMYMTNHEGTNATTEGGAKFTYDSVSVKKQ
jgi:hypothetical protein